MRASFLRGARRDELIYADRELEAKRTSHAKGLIFSETQTQANLAAEIALAAASGKICSCTSEQKISLTQPAIPPCICLPSATCEGNHDMRRKPHQARQTFKLGQRQIRTTNKCLPSIRPSPRRFAILRPSAQGPVLTDGPARRSPRSPTSQNLPCRRPSRKPASEPQCSRTAERQRGCAGRRRRHAPKSVPGPSALS